MWNQFVLVITQAEALYLAHAKKRSSMIKFMFSGRRSRYLGMNKVNLESSNLAKLSKFY
jgi:hypothetical protein